MIPAPVVHFGSRSVLAFLTVVVSRLTAFNFYKAIPFLPHSHSDATSIVSVEEKVENAFEETNMNVINSLTVSTDKLALKPDTLSSIVPSLIDVVPAPLKEQMETEFQTTLIQGIGENIDNIEHVSSLTSWNIISSMMRNCSSLVDLLVPAIVEDVGALAGLGAVATLVSVEATHITVMILGVLVVGGVGHTIYRIYVYNSLINRLLKDRNSLNDKYHENLHDLAIRESIRETIKSDELLKNLRLKGSQWEIYEDGRLVDVLAKVEKFEKVVEEVDKIL